MIATFITHPACHQHDMPAGHPECAARLDAIDNQLLSSGLDCLLYHREATAATNEQILRVHSAAYLQKIEQSLPQSGCVSLGDDVFVSPGTLNAARHAAGAGITAIDSIMKGETDVVFCNVRPAGHHAERDKGMGFCIFNNIAIAAAYAMDNYGMERIAIVDFDVHHGNGTQAIFLNDPRVLFCSVFQHPFYPDTPIAPVPQHIINIPLPATARSKEFREALNEKLFEKLEAFAPQLILISAGFDGYIDDDMSSMSLVEQDYAWIGRELRTLMDNSQQKNDAAQQCRGIVSILEGGYDIDSLGRCAMAHLKALAKL